MTKSNEVITEKPFPNSGVTRRLWTRGRGRRECSSSIRASSYSSFFVLFFLLLMIIVNIFVLAMSFPPAFH